MGSPESPWLFSQPCYPFRTLEGSWDMVRGPAATTWAPSRQPVLEMWSLQSGGETGHGDEKRVLQEWG